MVTGHRNGQENDMVTGHRDGPSCERIVTSVPRSLSPFKPQSRIEIAKEKSQTPHPEYPISEQLHLGTRSPESH